MKTYCATFEYQGEMRNTANGQKVPKNYDWWEPIVAHFIDRSDTFRIECWFDDYEGLISAARYGARNTNAGMKIVAQMEIWEGYIDEHFKYEIIKSPLDKEGKIKWYSIFFKNKNKTLFCSEKYGKKLSIFSATENDLDFLSNELARGVFSFYVWEDAVSGQEVGFESLLMGDDDLESLIEALRKNRPNREEEAQKGDEQE